MPIDAAIFIGLPLVIVFGMPLIFRDTQSPYVQGFTAGVVLAVLVLALFYLLFGLLIWLSQHMRIV